MEAEVTDLFSRVLFAAHRATPVTCAERGVSDVLHSVPTVKQRNRDSAQRRQSLQGLGNKTTQRGKRKLTHLVLHRNADGHRVSFGDEDQRNDPSMNW